MGSAAATPIGHTASEAPITGAPGAAAPQRDAAAACTGRDTQRTISETKRRPRDYRKENESDPTATPAPPQAAREQKRAAPLKKMSGLIPHIKTTPYDKRFPSTNQASHCWNRYNEYVMCLKKTESDEDACKPMRQLALSICPDDWWGKWDEEREEGTFSGVKMTDAAATAGH